MKLLLAVQYIMIGLYCKLELVLPTIIMTFMLLATFMYYRYEKPRNV